MLDPAHFLWGSSFSASRALFVLLTTHGHLHPVVGWDSPHFPITSGDPASMRTTVRLTTPTSYRTPRRCPRLGCRLRRDSFRALIRRDVAFFDVTCVPPPPKADAATAEAPPPLRPPPSVGRLRPDRGPRGGGGSETSFVAVCPGVYSRCR